MAIAVSAPAAFCQRARPDPTKGRASATRADNPRTTQLDRIRPALTIANSQLQRIVGEYSRDEAAWLPFWTSADLWFQLLSNRKTSLPTGATGGEVRSFERTYSRVEGEALERMLQDQVADLDDELELSDWQYAAVSALLSNHIARCRRVIAYKSAAEDVLRRKLEAIGVETDRRLSRVLDGAQLVTYERIRSRQLLPGPFWG